MPQIYGEANAQAFFDQAAIQYANYVFVRTGVRRSLLMAQMAVDTAYGSTMPWYQGWNPAGIMSGDRFLLFRNFDEAAAKYAELWGGNYPGSRSVYESIVRMSNEGAPVDELAIRLGNAGWFGRHYGGWYFLLWRPGQALINVINKYNLTAYDSLPEPTPENPNPTPPPKEQPKTPSEFPVWPVLGIFAAAGLGIGIWAKRKGGIKIGKQ